MADGRCGVQDCYGGGEGEREPNVVLIFVFSYFLFRICMDLNTDKKFIIIPNFFLSRTNSDVG